MVVTDCEINVQSSIPHCAPVAHRVRTAHPCAPLSLRGPRPPPADSVTSASSHFCFHLYLKKKSQSRCNKDSRIGRLMLTNLFVFLFCFTASSWQLGSRMLPPLRAFQVVQLWESQAGYLDKADVFTGPSRRVIHLPERRPHSWHSRSRKQASLPPSLPPSVFIPHFEQKRHQGCWTAHL